MAQNFDEVNLAYIVGLPTKKDLLVRYNAFKDPSRRLLKLPKRLFSVAWAMIAGITVKASLLTASLLTASLLTHC